MNFDYSPKVQEMQAMVLVPANTPGITVLRPLNVFDYDDAPHGQMAVQLKNARVAFGKTIAQQTVTQQRTLRLADGPDEVHRNSLGKLELARQMSLGQTYLPMTR